MKLFLLKFLNLFGLFIESDFFVIFIISMLPKEAREDVIYAIKTNDGLKDKTGLEKRKTVSMYLSSVIFEKIGFHYTWFQFIFEQLTDQQKNQLADAIVQVIYFGVRISNENESV